MYQLKLYIGKRSLIARFLAYQMTPPHNIGLFAGLFASFLLVGCQTSNVVAGSKVGSEPSTTTTTTSQTAKPSMMALSDSAILMVKNASSFMGHKTTTVGKAFDGSFHDGKWTSITTAEGELVVEFNGTISHRTLLNNNFAGGGTSAVCDKSADKNHSTPAEIDAAVACVAVTPVPVRFQFVISADQQTFELGHLNYEPFGSATEQVQEKILNFIYP